MDLTTAAVVLQQAIDTLNRAKEAQHKVGDIVDAARNAVNMVNTLGSLKGVEELMVQISALEAKCHKGMIDEMSKMQQAIRLVKGGN